MKEGLSMSVDSTCVGCKYRNECDLAIKVHELEVEYGIKILIPYCEDRA
jgi:hypothetical protein